MFRLYAMINKKMFNLSTNFWIAPRTYKLTTKEYKIRHETPTQKTLSKNYTKTTDLERSVASKLPGAGLKGIPNYAQTFALDLGVILSSCVYFRTQSLKQLHVQRRYTN